MVKHRASQKSPAPPSPPSPFMADIRFKLLRITRRHEQMKSAFIQLKSQIKIGLLEAEDVFASLSVPLMKLVGLKTEEMAEEGRSSTIIMDSDFQQSCQRNVSGSDTQARSPFPADGTDQFHKWKGKNYSTRATQAGKELMERQHLQLQKLVYLLRRIEANVNSCQDNILQTLNDHRVSLQKFYHKSILYLSTIRDRRIHTNETTLIITLNLLRATFENVGSVLGSVEDGVQDLMQELSETMCIPMVEYVKGLKENIGTGSLKHLIAVVDEMESVMRHGLSELEETKEMVRVEEQMKLEALSRLRESEDKRRAMKEFVGFLLEAKDRSKEPFVPLKFLAIEEVKAAYEESLEKRKVKSKSSPWGTKDLLNFLPTNKHRNQRSQPIVNHKSVTRSSRRGLSSRTPSPDSWPRLGSSPSILNHQAAVQNHNALSLVHVQKGMLQSSYNY